MTLETLPAWRLEEQPAAQGWLIEELWQRQAVGIVGGEPKCCKSFLALDMVVAVASGRPCLRRFPVGHQGPVLLYAAEDALHVVRRRLDDICQIAGVDIQALPIHVITVPTLRLDHDDDRRRLAETVALHEPVLLVLDPFVRLHRIDENASGEVAPILAWLRELQREHAVAVAVVHHARKGAGRLRGGQALRGSSEFHAWGDSNLYLRRHDALLTLSIEHRAARSTERIALRLNADGPHVALELAPEVAAVEPPVASLSVEARVGRALAEAGRPMPLAELRAQCRIRTATLCDALHAMAAAGQIVKGTLGYALSTP